MLSPNSRRHRYWFRFLILHRNGKLMFSFFTQTICKMQDAWSQKKKKLFSFTLIYYSNFDSVNFPHSILCCCKKGIIQSFIHTWIYTLEKWHWIYSIRRRLACCARPNCGRILWIFYVVHTDSLNTTTKIHINSKVPTKMSFTDKMWQAAVGTCGLIFLLFILFIAIQKSGKTGKQHKSRRISLLNI